MPLNDANTQLQRRLTVTAPTGANLTGLQALTVADPNVGGVPVVEGLLAVGTDASLWIGSGTWQQVVGGGGGGVSNPLPDDITFTIGDGTTNAQILMSSTAAGVGRGLVVGGDGTATTQTIVAGGAPTDFALMFHIYGNRTIAVTSGTPQSAPNADRAPATIITGAGITDSIGSATQGAQMFAQGGSSTSTNAGPSFGGQVNVLGGNAASTGAGAVAGGGVSIVGGEGDNTTGTSTGGSIAVMGGGGTTTGGAVTVQGGGGLNGAGDGASVTVTGGLGLGAGAAGGDVLLTAQTGSDVLGNIRLVTSNVDASGGVVEGGGIIPFNADENSFYPAMPGVYLVAVAAGTTVTITLGDTLTKKGVALSYQIVNVSWSVASGSTAGGDLLNVTTSTGTVGIDINTDNHGLRVNPAGTFTAAGNLALQNTSVAANLRVAVTLVSTNDPTP